MISGAIEVNQFALVCLILQGKFISKFIPNNTYNVIELSKVNRKLKKMYIIQKQE